MNRLVAPILIISMLALSAGVAQAMPFRSYQTQARLIAPVADGCGVGRYRGPNGECRRKYFRDRFAPRPYYSSCGGLGAHRVCNIFGQCWMVCD